MCFLLFHFTENGAKHRRIDTPESIESNEKTQQVDIFSLSILLKMKYPETSSLGKKGVP